MLYHDKILPGQFIMDLRNEYNGGLHQHHNAPSDIHRGYIFSHHNPHQNPEQPSSPTKLDAEVLDLSRRCDSVETRKTPSPYNSTSSFGTASPGTHCESPPNSNQATPQPVPVASSTIPPMTPNHSLHFAPPGLPLLTHGIASLYPMFYTVKSEIPSPPPQSGPIISSPLPAFGQSPALLLQHPLKTSPSPVPVRKSEEPESTNPLPLPETASSLFPSILNAATTGTIPSGKHTRPFNAYPRDPMAVAAHFTASDVLFDSTSTMERYSTYRKRALDDLRDTNGGHRVVSNPKMRRTSNRKSGSIEREDRAVESSDYDSSTGNRTSAEPGNKNDTNNNNENETTSNGGTVKDQAYYERRRKNNAAAKKSRDRRRIKEDEIAIRAAYLERQNIELLCQIDNLKKQLEMFTKV